MTLDWDGKIRMDCSSADAMASLIERRAEFQIATGNDADADRHGIVTPDAGLMNPNHFLAVAIAYLYADRDGWSPDAAVGKTLVSSSMIDRVAAALGPPPRRGAGRVQVVRARAARRLGRLRRRGVGRRLVPPPRRHRVDDGQGRHPARPAGVGDPGHHRALAVDALRRADGPARRPGLRRASTPRRRGRRRPASARLAPSDVAATELAGEPITGTLTTAPGNGAAIGGLKVVTASAWFAARPSGTEDVYKIYAESFRGPDHLAEVQAEARQVVAAALTD